MTWMSVDGEGRLSRGAFWTLYHVSLSDQTSLSLSACIKTGKFLNLNDLKAKTVSSRQLHYD